MHALGLEFGSAAQLSKRPGSVWNCLWGNALSEPTNEKSFIYQGDLRVCLIEIKAPTRWHCVTLQVQAFVQS